MGLLVEEADKDVISALAARFPTLRLVSTPPDRRIVGTFDLRHGGQLLAVYDVCVDLMRRDQLGLPTVWETGGRIPRIPDRHINQDDGSACLYIPLEFALQRPVPLRVVEFLEGPVWNFFLGQAWVENGMGWPFGEREHGDEGIRALCSEIFGVSTDSAIREYVDIIARDVLKGHWLCPCGSGRKLRQCHQAQVVELKRRFPAQLRRSLREQLGLRDATARH
jgi:hypothetical protein